MSKYSDKTFEKILDDMCKRVIEVSTMEGSYLGGTLCPQMLRKDATNLQMKLLLRNANSGEKMLFSIFYVSKR